MPNEAKEKLNGWCLCWRLDHCCKSCANLGDTLVLAENWILQLAWACGWVVVTSGRMGWAAGGTGHKSNGVLILMDLSVGLCVGWLEGHASGTASGRIARSSPAKPNGTDIGWVLGMPVGLCQQNYK